MIIILSIITLWLIVVTIQLIAIRRWVHAQEIKERPVPSGVKDNQNMPRTRVDS